MLTTFVIGFALMTNVNAEECNPQDKTELEEALSGSCPIINLDSTKSYENNEYTINHNVIINGNGAKVVGTFTLEGSARNVEFNNLTITATDDDSNGSYPELIAIKTNSDLKVSNVTLYSGNDFETSSKFTKNGTGIVVYDSDGENSNVTIENSNIRAKYAVWIEGSNSNLTINGSELSGYAALDLTSNDSETSNNKIIIDNSILTGYALGNKEGNNDYGTIVVGNKSNVNINIINNSLITNNFENNISSRNDLILISNYDDNISKQVNIAVSDSTLKNNATNNDLGAIYNANELEENTFKTQNTNIIGNLIAGEKEQFYVNFVVDNKSNIILVNANTKVDVNDIPSVTKEGYTFDGWFDENNNIFKIEDNVTKNITVYARFTKITETNSDTITNENPSTIDNISLYFVIVALGITGLGFTIKKFIKNR